MKWRYKMSSASGKRGMQKFALRESVIFYNDFCPLIESKSFRSFSLSTMIYQEKFKSGRTLS
jgi:hypothetical protein